MTVQELSREELNELKQNYLIENYQKVSYGIIAEVDTLVSDKEIYEAYKDIDFVPDDFFCNL